MIFIDEDKHKKEIGIYKITNTVNKKVYIGQTKDGFQRRYWLHKWQLNSEKHDNPHLQKSWNKYGAESFKFSIVEVSEKDLIDEREVYWISFYRSNGECYNIQDGGQPLSLNNYISPEIRKRTGELNRKRMMGSKLSEDTKKKMSETRKGKYVKRHNDTLTEEQATQAKKQLVSGTKPSQVAKDLNVDYKSINNLLSLNTYSHIFVDGWNEFQSTRKKYKRVLEKEDIINFQEKYDSGLSISEIARQTGCARETIRKYTKQ